MFKPFLVFLSGEFLCPWQLFSFCAMLELVCAASSEGGEKPANSTQAGLVLVSPECTPPGWWCPHKGPMGTAVLQGGCRQSRAQTTKPRREEQGTITSDRIPSQHTRGETLWNVSPLSWAHQGTRRAHKQGLVWPCTAATSCAMVIGGHCRLVQFRASAHMWPMMPKGSKPGSKSQLSTLTSAPPLGNVSHLLLIFGLARALLPSDFLLFHSFPPTEVITKYYSHMYSLLFFQAESHFIVSSSYFLLLSRSLCNNSLSSVGFATFSRPGSLANGLNKSHKPVPHKPVPPHLH